MRKIVAARDYIMLKSGSLEFFVGRRYFGMLRVAMKEAERMRDGESKVIALEF